MTDRAGKVVRAQAAAASADGGREPAIRVVDVTKEYPGGVQALGGVSFDVPAGELTSVIGPSGCGKTTTLKMIAGLVEPTAGQIHVQGRVVQGPGPERAFVFQDFALMPWATVLRNVAFGLELRGVSRKQREAVAREHIARINLTGFEQAYPHQLSGGMRQRVGLARALAVDADILLMDEPFASVDEQIRRKFQEDLLTRLSEERKTVVFVTHSIEEAVYVSDQIVILTRGPGRVSKVGASRRDLHLKIILFAALPEILAGVRLGLIRGAKGVVIGQLRIAVVGVGYLFELYSRSFSMPEFWALLIIVFAFAFMASEGVAHLERRVAFYATSR